VLHLRLNLPPKPLREPKELYLYRERRFVFVLSGIAKRVSYGHHGHPDGKEGQTIERDLASKTGIQTAANWTPTGLSQERKVCKSV
jgi:hypothetical protein